MRGGAERESVWWRERERGRSVWYRPSDRRDSVRTACFSVFPVFICFAPNSSQSCCWEPLCLRWSVPSTAAILIWKQHFCRDLCRQIRSRWGSSVRPLPKIFGLCRLRSQHTNALALCLPHHTHLQQLLYLSLRVWMTLKGEKLARLEFAWFYHPAGCCSAGFAGWHTRTHTHITADDVMFTEELRSCPVQLQLAPSLPLDWGDWRLGFQTQKTFLTFFFNDN